MTKHLQIETLKVLPWVSLKKDSVSHYMSTKHCGWRATDLVETENIAPVYLSILQLNFKKVIGS